MLTPKQQRIIGMFAANVFKERSFSELKRLSKGKSHSVLQGALARFREERLVTERTIGATKLYRLNLDNEASLAYLSLDAQARLGKASQALASLRREIEKVTQFTSLVVFGSYAAGTQTPSSDLDVAIILPDTTMAHKVKAAANTAANRSPVELDAHVITSADFIAMLLADYENLGKEIARKHLAVTNNAIFYGLVRGGMAHGFRHEALP